MERGYSVVETSKYLGIKVRTVREWIRLGKIHATKLEGSNRWVIMESEIKRIRGDVAGDENKN